MNQEQIKTVKKISTQTTKELKVAFNESIDSLAKITNEILDMGEHLTECRHQIELLNQQANQYEHLIRKAKEKKVELVAALDSQFNDLRSEFAEVDEVVDLDEDEYEDDDYDEDDEVDCEVEDME